MNPLTWSRAVLDRDIFPCDALRIAAQSVRVFVPVAQDPAVAGVSVDMVKVMRGAVGVSVNYSGVVVRLQQFMHGLRIHVHDAHGFLLFFLRAFFA